MPRSSRERTDRVRLITYAGEHDGNLLFICPSFTDPSIEYEIVLDKEKAEVRCSCLDASCRHKVWDIYSPKPTYCKHVAVLREHVLPTFRKYGVI